MKALKQALRIVAGYLAATLVALLIGLLLPVLLPAQNLSEPIFTMTDSILLAGLYWLILAAFAITPVLIAVVIAEAIKLRSLIAHILIGGVIGFLFTGHAARISPWLNLSDGPMQDMAASVIMVLAGALGAIAYWQIAGKHAGSWRERPSEQRQAV
jgi:F0F1-type ATP synthase assembly protein I